jgi:hypothetical protein
MGSQIEKKNVEQETNKKSYECIIKKTLDKILNHLFIIEGCVYLCLFHTIDVCEYLASFSPEIYRSWSSLKCNSCVLFYSLIKSIELDQLFFSSLLCIFRMRNKIYDSTIFTYTFWRNHTKFPLNFTLIIVIDHFLSHIAII